MNNNQIHKPLHTKEEFLTNPELTSYPWTMSPFAVSLINADKTLTNEEKELCLTFAKDGFVIIDLDLPENFEEDLVKSLDECPGDSYFYNPQTVRYFEAWKYSKHVRQLAANKKILDTLKLLYRREAVPFQTINFISPSEQDVHSDTLHFHTTPNHWMAGVWTALEPMDEENGTLRYFKGSHKLPITEFHNLNMIAPKWSHKAGGYEQESYDTYEEYVKALMTLGYEEHKYIGPKGKAIIWSANVLHGGSPLLDRTRTRKAQATHYYFKDMPGIGKDQRYYCPMYSNESLGEYSLKKVDEKDILGLHKKLDY
tara:strand:- start:1648 stop:2583 length:936 start_codon:yes stop_codon:yes gene_type:complete